jgi:putative hydrolases of HD superfamily
VTHPEAPSATPSGATSQATLEALLEAARLKAVDRAGWLRVGITRPESVAAHSWGVAWLVMVLLPADLDRERALAYAVLHDLAEARVGDLTPHDGVAAEEKVRRERAGMEALCGRLPNGAELLATWETYEAQADPEARFVRQLDRLDMAIQALAYQRGGAADTAQFVESAAKVIDHPALVPLLEQIRVACSAGRDLG